MTEPVKGGILAALRRSPLVGADLDLTRPHEHADEIRVQLVARSQRVFEVIRARQALDG